MRSLILCAALALPFTVSGCGSFPAVLAAVAQGAQFLGSAIDLAESGSQQYFARHPSLDGQNSVASAIHTARLASVALNASVAASKAADDGDIAKARKEALTSYRALLQLLDSLGIPQAEAPAGGAETDSPEPEPFVMPSADDVAARL